MQEGLKVLTGPAEYEVVIRKSRFLARAVALDNPDAAAVLLAELSVAAASHNCWAWRHGEQYRFSDDGEPGGTAGRPILAAIENQGFDQCLVLVTRWYGGIQLGTGGLARAYGGAAVACLQSGKTKTLVPQVELQAFCPYPALEHFKSLLNVANACIMEEIFGAEGAQLLFSVAPLQQEHLQASLQNLSRGEGWLAPRDTPSAP